MWGFGPIVSETSGKSNDGCPLWVSYDCCVTEMPLWNDLWGLQAIFFFVASFGKISFPLIILTRCLFENPVGLQLILGESVPLGGAQCPRPSLDCPLRCMPELSDLCLQVLPRFAGPILGIILCTCRTHSSSLWEVHDCGNLRRCIWWWEEKALHCQKHTHIFFIY